jgi:hypothetical protein
MDDRADFNVLFCSLLRHIGVGESDSSRKRLIASSMTRFVSNHIQQFLDSVYKDGNTQLVDASLFPPYSSGDHRYLIAKAYITFYNDNARQQQTRGILIDADSGWTFSISPERLDYLSKLAIGPTCHNHRI